MASEIEKINVRRSKSGIPLFFFSSVDGKSLDRKKKVRSQQEIDVRLKTEELSSSWDRIWEKVLEVTNSETNQGYDRGSINRFFVALAKELTDEAEFKVSQIQSVLVDGVNASKNFGWQSLRNFYFYKETPLTSTVDEVSASMLKPFDEPEPNIADQKYKITFSFMEKLIGQSRNKSNQNIALFESDHSAWLSLKQAAEAKAREIAEKSRLAKEQTHKSEIKNSENAKVLSDRSKAITELKSQYDAGNADAIVEYSDIALGMSDYPDAIQNIYDLEYIPSTKTLLVEYLLPYLDDIPKFKEWKYTATKGLLSPKELSQAELNRIYDEVIYQTTLRVIYELYNSDEGNYIDSIVFNGRVKFIDKSSGHETSACILSLQASKDEFMAINLAYVDAKTCFKTLKGVASSKLHGISPIAPIMNMRREDGRFVSAQEIANTVNDSTNLAAMDWQDFEHLIREIFEKEFSTNGGEVKITQASRDGGVDAVAFDPDPIRGGKIVIQAKRYTNTVTVSAVRDLYGTVMNEGATKGILVTTSDYGPDAYNFIKDKPLVLLNGANLLHLLEKHGHRARIDIQEAKLMNG